MPRIANFRTYFCKKKILGEDPQTTPDPTFNTTFSCFIFCPPPPSPLFGTKLRHLYIQISYRFEWYPIIITYIYYMNDSPYYYKTLYRTRPFTEFWVVSIEHLRWVWHADRGRLLLRTAGPVPLGLACVLLF